MHRGSLKIFCILIITLLLFLTSTNALKVGTINDNTPPNPPVIEGPISGKINEFYTYSITITDPDEDDYLLKLEVDFGDGIIVEDCGCGSLWNNGEIIEIEHSWKKQGTYQIKARVADENNYWSEWSEPIPVTMPRNRLIFFDNIYLKILQIFLSYFKIPDFDNYE
jgi:hypothetical protein